MGQGGAQIEGPGNVLADRLPVAPSRPLPLGFDALIDGLIGTIRRLPWRARRVRRLGYACADQMVRLESVPNADLQLLIQTHRDAFRRDRSTGRGALLEALAVVGEVAARELGLRPYPVQLMGALALHQGWLAEMATGEGKTLTVAMAAVLAGWSGRPCHLVTANDYLAARDALKMGPLYRACGVSVNAVTGDLAPAVRAARYACDIVYVTAKELLADYLRDRRAANAGEGVERWMLRRWLWKEGLGHGQAANLLLVRGLHTALIDEADSVLIDEAVTPLILSASRYDPDLSQAVLWASEVADRLSVGADYEIIHDAVILRPAALDRTAESANRLPHLWQVQVRREDLLRQALVARHLLLRDQHYVVLDGKIMLLDEGTGRLTPGRTLAAGLHQAVEAHEGLAISDPSQSLDQMSFQAFFRHFRRLAGTTGTACEARAEFWSIYHLAVLTVPTHRPFIRTAAPPRVLGSETEKNEALLAEVERLHRAGLPVLLGVRSISSSERVAELLRARGLPFRLLNAVRLGEEAEIIAQAGQAGRITVATNMAGRGTDIVLGRGVAAMGGLQVIVAECNESLRIDRQLAGRCGRQGDPGRVSVFVSADDPLLTRHLSPRWCAVIHCLAGCSAGWARPLLGWIAMFAVRLAQRRSEVQGRQQRRAVLESDEWMAKALPFDG